MVPAEGTKLRWEYGVLLRLGPWLLTLVGLALVVLSVILDRGEPLLIALLTEGVGLMIAAVLLPRVRGSISVAHVEGNLLGALEADPEALQRPSINGAAESGDCSRRRPGRSQA